MCGTNGKCSCKSHLENEENRELIRVAKALEECFKDGGVFRLPSRKIEDIRRYDSIEIKTMEGFKKYISEE